MAAIAILRLQSGRRKWSECLQEIKRTQETQESRSALVKDRTTLLVSSGSSLCKQASRPRLFAGTSRTPRLCWSYAFVPPPAARQNRNPAFPERSLATRLFHHARSISCYKEESVSYAETDIIVRSSLPCLVASCIQS
jgi:hypothetical protein